MPICKVLLENYTGAYYPGQEIRGQLECFFAKETTICSVKIQLKCKEHNEWTRTEVYTDPHTRKRRTRTITLVGDNNVFNSELIIYGNDSRTCILEGRHIFHFSYTLPENIPSTFVGPYGYVIFKLKAVVVRPVLRFDLRSELPFIVLSPIDFNKMPVELQQPTNYSDEKSVGCCWLCHRGYVSLKVELPKKAFVPGEILFVKVQVSNMSSTKVKSLRVKLKKIITYMVTCPRMDQQKEIDDIVTYRELGVEAGCERTYNLQLAIPKHLMVPNFTLCRLFDAGYCLKVSCEMARCTLDLNINIRDIAMGHVQWTQMASAPPIGNPPYPSGSNVTGYPMPTPTFVPLGEPANFDISQLKAGPSNFDTNDLIPPPTYEEVLQQKS